MRDAPPTVAIVLAAGVGSRLRPYTDDRPKCLVSIGRETILHRAVRLLAASGVSRLIVSTGYRAEAVHAALANEAALRVSYVHNPDYDATQNVVSLARAMRAVAPGERVIKLDGDVVFEPEVLRALRAHEAPGVVAIERAPEGSALGPEPMKVELDAADRVVRFGKGLPPERAHGESIGIECFAPEAAPLVAAALDAAVRAGRTDVYYEDVYNDVLDAVAMVAEPVSPSAWFEIDDEHDLVRARARFG